MLLHISEEAAGDLEDIFDYWLDRVSIETANRLLDNIGDRLSLLARHPRAGRSCAGYGSETRCIAAGKYLIYYRITQPHVEVIRVLHGARDQRRALGTKKKRS